MRQQVFFKVGVRHERFITRTTSEVFLAVVALHVHRKTAGLREPFVADRANVRAFARVGPPVHDQSAGPVETWKSSPSVKAFAGDGDAPLWQISQM